MIYLLWIFFVVMLIISLIITKFDIFSPIIIFCMVYLISVTCAIYNIERWGIRLHYNTFFIFIYGTLIFFFVSFIILQKYSKNNIVKQLAVNRLNYIIIKKYKIVLICIYDFIILSIIYYYISKIAFHYNSFSGFSDMVYTFRYYSAYNAEIQTPFWINQLAKILDCSSYIFLYIFINNVLCSKRKIKYNLILIIPILATVFKSFLYGARAEFLSIITAFIVMYYILWNRKYNWCKKLNFKFYFRLLLLFLFTILLFYFLLTVVGRKSQIGFLNYITNYAGGSIQLFDMFMQVPIVNKNGWGSETFVNLHNFVYKIIQNRNNSLISIHLEYQYYNNINIGNVYTEYRRWINDFGIFGMSILQIILAYFYNVFYYKLKWSIKIIKDNSNLILYAYLINKLFLHSVGATFFNSLISTNFIIIFILYKLLFKFFISKNINLNILKGSPPKIQWK